MPPKFGTDGIRGLAGSELSREVAAALGRAAARVLGRDTYLLGRDTRLSGPELEAALSDGLTAEGCDVVSAGVIPTPGLAWLAAEDGRPAAMISASHNPYEDNGIKLFGPGGTKLAVDVEQSVQAELDSILANGSAGSQAKGQAGRSSVDSEAAARYGEHLLSVVEGARMPEGEVVVDCANGAASAVAPEVFSRLGVAAHVMNASPDGRNINAGCGSTHLDPLRAAVLARGAALGLAFDGDADRLLAVDDRGETVDGDDLIVLFASDLAAAGALTGNTVVVTVLSNLGLRQALKAKGIDVVEVPVGDRHVTDALEAGGFAVGGEQSGHLIFSRHASTGDGLLTGLKLLELVGRTGRPLGELASEAMRRVPQVLLNVAVPDPMRLSACDAVWIESGRVERELGDSGRVLLRASGTESCIRVMVEAPTQEAAESHARSIASVVEREIG